MISNLLTITTPEPEKKKSGKNKHSHSGSNSHVDGKLTEKVSIDSPIVPSQQDGQDKRLVSKLPSLKSMFSLSDSTSFDEETSDQKRAVLLLVGFTGFALFVASFIQQFLTT